MTEEEQKKIFNEVLKESKCSPCFTFKEVISISQFSQNEYLLELRFYDGNGFTVRGRFPISIEDFNDVLNDKMPLEFYERNNLGYLSDATHYKSNYGLRIRSLGECYLCKL